MMKEGSIIVGKFTQLIISALEDDKDCDVIYIIFLILHRNVVHLFLESFGQLNP